MNYPLLVDAVLVLMFAMLWVRISILGTRGHERHEELLLLLHRMDSAVMHSTPVELATQIRSLHDRFEVLNATVQPEKVQEVLLTHFLHGVKLEEHEHRITALERAQPEGVEG